MRKLIIRPIEAGDNVRLKEIIQSVLKSYQLDIPNTAYFDPQLDYLFEHYQQQEGAAYWVLEDKGEVVGGVGIGPFDLDRGICELQKLYLLEDYRGQGWASQLMDQAMTFATKYYSACYIETHHNLEDAQALYSKFDFEPLAQALEGTEHSAMDRWYLKYF